MLKARFHEQLAQLKNWQSLAFMVCLCERAYPNFYFFCQQVNLDSAYLYRNILNLFWESLLIKKSKVNFEKQLDKLEAIMPNKDDFDLYAVYPAIDACIILSETIHAYLTGEFADYVRKISDYSLETVMTFEMVLADGKITEQELHHSDAVKNEMAIQQQLYHVLTQSDDYDYDLLFALRAELKEDKTSNIGVTID